MGRKTPNFADLKSTSEQASAAMRGNRAQDTAPEVMLRKILWHRGYRYRTHVSELAGKPDIVFTRQQVAVFCDGDFWHGRHWEQRRKKLREGANSEYWIAKIKSNRERDERQTRELEDEGWTVVRVWEGEVKSDPADAADRVEAVLRRLGS